MDNNKNKILTLIAIITIVLTLIGATYAYFAAQAGGTTSTNTTVTSNTTDLLTFSINQDISFTVTQSDFQENGTNKSGDATATATLTPNNKTGNATMNYYMYLNLQSNPTVYSSTNTNHDPELMLQVFDGNNQLVTLTGLGTQKTIKGVTGYDITGVTGLKTLLDNHAISASNNTATIENWRVVITLINLDVDQNDNTGKEIRGTIIINKEEMTVCDLNPGSCITLNVNNPASLPGKSVTLTSSGINAVWNDKYNQLEVSSMGELNEVTITYETPSVTTPFSTYLIGLSGTTQGDGQLVHEIGHLADYTNTSVVTSFGTTPVYFRNTSYNSTAQTEVDSYWTFNSTTGIFTSDPSKMLSDDYYHAYAQVPEAGFYQICYTIAQAPNAYNYLYISRNTTLLINFSASTTGAISETCYDMGYFQASDYIRIIERGYDGTSSPVITFRIEKGITLTFDSGYRYEGINPNNYVMFNNELWRIIGVFSTEYDSDNDGTTDATANLVKIIREDSIGGLEWNKSGTNDWANSSLYHLLNEQYYDWETNKASVSTYCYGYSTITPAKCDYSVDGIQDGYRGMIVKAKWYLGGGGKEGYTTYIPDSIYSYERDANAIYSGRSASTPGYIGLMYESDYLYGVLASDCARTTAHGSYSGASCAGKDWLYGKGDEWTISPNSNLNAVWYLGYTGLVGDISASISYGVRPVLYLSSSVYKVSGTGTITNPYIIGM